MKKNTKEKKSAKGLPWQKYFDEAGVPAHLEYPDCSMVDMVIRSAERWPDNIAYSYYGHKVTFKNFVKKIEKAARALKNYGVKEGDRVTICMPNTPEGITMVYAVNMVGAVCNMVHPLSSEKELEYYIKVAESKYVLVIDAVFDKIYRLRDTASLERIIVVRPSAGLGFLKKKLYNALHIKRSASQRATTALYSGKISLRTLISIKGITMNSAAQTTSRLLCIQAGRLALRKQSCFRT